MPFFPANQQHQSTEGKCGGRKPKGNWLTRVHKKMAIGWWLLLMMVVMCVCVCDGLVSRVLLFIWSWASAAGKCSLSCRASSWNPRALFSSQTTPRNWIVPWFWRWHEPSTLPVFERLLSRSGSSDANLYVFFILSSILSSILSLLLHLWIPD